MPIHESTGSAPLSLESDTVIIAASVSSKPTSALASDTPFFESISIVLEPSSLPVESATVIFIVLEALPSQNSCAPSVTVYFPASSEN